MIGVEARSTIDDAVYSFPFDQPQENDEEPEFSRLRAQDPICRVRLPYAGEAWLVTRYREVRDVLGDRQFGRAATVEPDVPRLLPDPGSEGLLQSLDPPEHVRVRGVVQRAFTPRQIEWLRPRAQAVAETLIESMVGGGAPADLVGSFALPLPVAVVSELLGIPEIDRSSLRRWTTTLLSTTVAEPTKKSRTFEEMLEFFGDLVADRRRRPGGDDLLSNLVQLHDEDGERLTEREVVLLCSDILLAGHETTAAQLANSVASLLRAGGLKVLSEDAGEIARAVEELLRVIPLGAGAFRCRVARADTEIAGVTIRAGEAVFAPTTSANRDSTVFNRAERMDLGRVDNPHLAFGHGQHHCLGASLARMQLQVALGLLRRRLPALALAVRPQDLVWRTGSLVRGPVELPVRW
jgi:cytochrome P450